MAFRGSRAEYEARMHRVIEHMDKHLDQPLNLEGLAAVAHFSAFHFHRIFSAWMGETLGDYLRRRRVEIAAMRLVSQPRVSVLQIALSVGFGSGEAFARAFRCRFGCSPTSWREGESERRTKKSKLSQVDRKRRQEAANSLTEHENSHKPGMESIMNVKLVNRQPVTVAYLRHLGPYGESLSRFWQDTYYPWAATNNLLAQPRLGISHDDPSITAPEKCRYDACVEIEHDSVVSGDALKKTIPGGRYAVLRVKGGVAEIGDAWASLLRDWLPSSGLQLDARPAFEYYPKDAACDPRTGVMECDICVPVAPL